MVFLGFHSFAEFNTYLTFVCLGMSIMMVISAITSAPAFVTEYFKYATGEPEAVAEAPIFWNNANTFFNAGTYVMQVITEVISLTPFVRGIPLRARMLVGLVIPFLELLIIIVIPAAKIPTQNGAIAVLMVVSVIGGFSKALCDTATNALVGPFPTKFMNGAQWGLTVSALFMSLIQVILKASMGTSFEDVLTQSRIYFGIGMFIQVVTVIEFCLLPHNQFAQKYIAEFRVAAGALDGVDSELGVSPGEPNAEEDVAAGEIQMETSRRASAADKEKALQDDDDEQVRAVDANAAVLRASGDADNMHDLDQSGNLTSTQQMLNVTILSVFRKVWPMLICCFTVFFTSLLIFPGVFFHVDLNDGWYMTLIATLFNVGDFVARIVLMVRVLRPSPKVVLGGTFGRLILIPFLVLCVRGIIKGHALPYVLIILLGLTNGYFGTMSAIHCPRTPTLQLAGERSIAGVLGGIFMMGGLCVGSNLALAINLTI